MLRGLIHTIYSCTSMLKEIFNVIKIKENICLSHDDRGFC